MTPLFPEDFMGRMHAWFAARKPECSPGATNGNNISQCLDLSGNGNNLTPNNVKYLSSASMGKPAFSLPNGSTLISDNDFFNGNNVTLIAVWKIVADGEIFWNTVGPSFILWQAIADPLSYLHNQFTVRISPTSNTRSDNWHIYSTTVGSDLSFPGIHPFSVMSHQWIDMTSACNVQAYNPPGANTPLSILDRGGHIELAELIVLDEKTPFVDIQRLNAGLASIYETNFPAKASIYALGNSTTSLGGGLTLPLSKVLEDFDCATINFAVPSGFSTTVISNLDEVGSLVDYDISIGRIPVVLIHTGHNDALASDAIDLFENPWIQHQRNKGAKIVVVTQTAWQDSSGKETKRQILNQWIRDNQNIFDGIVDAGADPLLGSYPRVAEGDACFDDYVHLNQVGHLRLSNLAKPVIEEILSTGTPNYSDRIITATTSNVQDRSITLSVSLNKGVSQHITYWVKYNYPVYVARSKNAVGIGDSLTDNNVVPSTNYYYQAVIYDSKGYFVGVSNVVKVKTLSASSASVSIDTTEVLKPGPTGLRFDGATGKFKRF